MDIISAAIYNLTKMFSWLLSYYIMFSDAMPLGYMGVIYAWKGKGGIWGSGRYLTPFAPNKKNTCVFI